MLTNTTVAQIRQTNPSTNRQISPVAQQTAKDTIPTTRSREQKTQLVLPKKQNVITTGKRYGNYQVTDSYIQPNLKRTVTYIGSDPDVKPPVLVTEYHTGELKYITGKTETPQWQSDFLWHHIPANASAARFEISTLPFPLTEDKDFTGIIETRTINKVKNDSIKFNIVFKQQTKAVQPANSREKINTLYNNGTSIQLKTSSILLDALKTYGTYYVRLLALDSRGAVISKAVNSIKIVPDYINFPPPPIPTSEDSLQSDYEITSVKYIQMHYPEAAFTNCIVVTGYPEPVVKQEQLDYFGPMGIKWKQEDVNIFKTTLPVGTIICPSPPKEKSWYEKVFNSVTDAAAWTVNGASKVYTETKDYLKSKFSEYMCNYDPAVSTNKKLLQQSGLDKKQIDDGCNTATGVAFEMAMSYAGMPPSIPNFDEMCKLAKGQIVQMLIQKAVEQTGMPCDETCVELVAKELDKMIEESSKKNTQNGGFFNYKPDPRGQYRMPYVEIEITRKRKTQKGGPLFTNLYFTPYVEKTFSSTDINGKPYTSTITTGDVYEKIQLPVPYLKEVEDKIKLIAILTPKTAFVVTTCSDKKVIGISPKQLLCLGWNTIEQPGDDPKNSSGYSMMVEKATIAINPAGKIKLANGVNTKFPHHQ
jgi:hypothetical protein